MPDAIQAFPYVYVDDSDSICRRTLALQAIPLEAPADMPSGDRRLRVRDARGNVWQIATHQRGASADEIRSRLADCR
ncbi:Glyoxalase/bleomycin resistance protein/dioxygenase [Burkholderia cenocepacia]|nr:Glyoxalase/bleomycin resistance protein/dioxygenase [Burkholderia cenocepacia]